MQGRWSVVHGVAVTARNISYIAVEGRYGKENEKGRE
jgi:hypothetical protein